MSASPQLESTTAVVSEVIDTTVSPESDNMGATLPETDTQNRTHSEVAATSFFRDLATYSHLTLDQTTADYNLLSKMNEYLSSNFSNLADSIGQSNNKMEKSQQIYQELAKYLPLIISIQKSVDSLSNNVEALDVYSKRLEARFKTLAKLKRK